MNERTATVENHMTTPALCAYEGWSVERLQDFLARHGLASVPVIASDHQLVGQVGLTNIYALLHGGETYRARLINDSFRRATGQDVENLDELTRWTRRAQVYTTVHQIMEPARNLDAGASLDEARRQLVTLGLDRIPVTREGELVGSIGALELLASDV